MTKNWWIFFLGEMKKSVENIKASYFFSVERKGFFWVKWNSTGCESVLVWMFQHWHTIWMFSVMKLFRSLRSNMRQDSVWNIFRFYSVFSQILFFPEFISLMGGDELPKSSLYEFNLRLIISRPAALNHFLLHCFMKSLFVFQLFTLTFQHMAVLFLSLI